MALMARTMSFRGHFSVNVGAGIVQCTVALCLAAAGYSTFALAWATFANAVARSLIAQMLRPAPPWPLRFDGLRPILSVGRLTWLYACYGFTARTPDMIVGKLLGLLRWGSTAAPFLFPIRFAW
jgi:hypothetical protein